MKTLLLFSILALLAFSSCASTDSSKVCAQLTTEVDSLNKLILEIRQEKDSLYKVTRRWDPNRYHCRMAGNSDYYTNSADLESLTWSYMLYFDDDLLNTKAMDKSDHTTWSTRNDVMQVYKSIKAGNFVVDSRFEADRFNYFISTTMINVYAQMLADLSNDGVSNSDIPEDDKLMMVNTFIGLMYKDMYKGLSSTVELEEKIKKSLLQIYGR